MKTFIDRFAVLLRMQDAPSIVVFSASGITVIDFHATKKENSGARKEEYPPHSSN